MIVKNVFFLAVVLLLLNQGVIADSANFVEQYNFTTPQEAQAWVYEDEDTFLVMEESSVDVFVRDGENIVHQAELMPSGLGNDFGVWAMDIDEDTVVISGVRSSIAATEAYVFVRSGTTWTQQAQLIAAGVVRSDDFGDSVLVEGERILVSAPATDNSKPGAIYEFIRTGSTWDHHSTISASDGFDQNGFGAPFRLVDDILVVGAADYVSFAGGAVYVFRLIGDTWVEETKLTSPDGGDLNARFGRAIAFNGDRVAISTRGATLPYGKVYIFKRSGSNWALEAQLKHEIIVSDPTFGTTLALDGNLLLVSARWHYEDTARGAVYVYERSGAGVWSKQQFIRPHTPPTYFWGSFGQTIVLRGDKLLIGSYFLFEDLYGFVRGGTPQFETELLINEGFEYDTNGDLTPDGWERINMTADVNKCLISNGVFKGNCLYHFKSIAGEDSYLKQDIDLQNFDFQAGDVVTLTGYINAKGADVDVRARVLVKYNDSNLPNDVIVTRYFAPTNGWVTLSGDLTLTLAGEPRVMRLILHNQGTDGRVRFDTMSLKWQPNIGGGLIPLPNAPDGSLQSRK